MFTHKIEFGFGCELDRNHKRIPARKLAKILKLLEAAARLRFGGCTLVATRGTWVNDEGTIFSERGYTLIVYTGKAGIRLSSGMGAVIREVLQQEAVCVSITKVNAYLV